MGFIRNGVILKARIRVGRETVSYLNDLDLTTYLQTKV